MSFASACKELRQEIRIDDADGEPFNFLVITAETDLEGDRLEDIAARIAA